MGIEISFEGFEDLSDEEKNCVSDNGSGKEYASYIKIKHNGKTILLKSDAMEPEDAGFPRDLNWIVDALKMCYRLGIEDAMKVE